jgi:FkbM family methyltransferase
MSFFIDAYAKLIYLLFTFLLRLTYKQPETTSSFSSDKHKQMVKLSKTAFKVFDLLVKVIGKKTKYCYTMPVDYESSKILIRPFIFSEIVMVSGLWETYVKSILDKEVKNNDIIVDVGANIGVYAIPLAKRVNKVIAFEPHPKTSEMLEKSIELNHVHNIALVKKIIGDSKKKVLYGLSDIPMESGITNTPIKDLDSTIELESIDLDTALIMENKIDWLLIDVEGSEVNVLNGARSILRNYSPKIIIEVFHYNVDKVNEILMKEGYSISQLYDIYYYAVKK